ncbi:MAG: hypothetical protein WC769_02280 [Thermodesulfovibrionales bacterium]|jgi:hypothetical protein
MIENEIIKLQTVSTFKLIVSAYLLFHWIPKKVLPQEYIDNSPDRIMFNIIHMVAFITLIFPLFIYMKIFGVMFLFIFFISLKLLFLKYYFKKDVAVYLQNVYIYTVTDILKTLENPKMYLSSFKSNAADRIRSFKLQMTSNGVLYWGIFSVIMLYALYIRVYRGYISLVGAAPDMYQFYYWGNILKVNILFDKTAGAPYMWGGPVLVHTVNQFANLNTVVMYNIFPVLFLFFMFFTIFYVLRKLFESEGQKTASMFVALLLFGIILPSPISEKLFGLIYGIVKPEILQLFPFSFYYPSALDLQAKNVVTTPSVFFWRFTTTLPYEIASAFFLINLYFLIRFLESKKNLYLLLYAESLAIIFSIHGGVAIPLLCSSLPVFIYALAVRKMELKVLTRFIAVVAAAGILGNLWLLQIMVYKFTIGLGAAAPLLEKLFKTGSALKAFEPAGALLILAPTSLILALVISSFVLAFTGIFPKGLSFRLASVGLISIGVLFIYFAPNLGFPRIVDHSRQMVFIAYAYSLVAGTLYYLIVEKWFLKALFKNVYFTISLILILIISIFTISLTPRWIDTELFRKNVHDIEYKEFPFLVYKIGDVFQPFSYTIVSYVQEFPQVISKGYHMNTQDFLQMYDPSEKDMKFPSEYIFVFVENAPKEYQGLGEYWYRWRRDIMLKLKDWVGVYASNHDNIKLWYRSRWVDAYIIDNRTHESLLLKQQREFKEIGR